MIILSLSDNDSELSLRMPPHRSVSEAFENVGNISMTRRTPEGQTDNADNGRLSLRNRLI